jgi:ankyrin repeat protein
MLLPVAICAIWYRREVRQNALDHALVDAIHRHDDPAAIALLHRGADGAVVDRPFTTITLRSALMDMWHRLRAHKANHYPPILAHVYGLLGFMQPDTSIDSMIFADGKVDFNRDEDQASHTRLISELLAHGASLKTLDDGEAVDSELLYYASIACDAPTIKLLLEHHVNPNPAQPDGVPPLMCTNDFDCVRLLLEHGANPNLSYSGGRTRLMHVVDPRLYPLLIQHGANVNAKDDDGQTALIRLFQSNYLSDEDIHIGLRFLLKQGKGVD